MCELTVDTADDITNVSHGEQVSLQTNGNELRVFSWEKK